MTDEPSIVEREAQPYVGIRRVLPMSALATLADRIPELSGWLAERGTEPAGAPFFRYNVIDMDNEMDLEVGVPISSVPVERELAGAGDVHAGVLPAGRYATVVHIGHPDELFDVTTDLLTWADKQGLGWDSWQTERGEAWGCRLESYLTDPAVEPDMHKWQVRLLFRLAG
jgi:effector-binding domain-containing protein